MTQSVKEVEGRELEGVAVNGCKWVRGGRGKVLKERGWRDEKM